MSTHDPAQEWATRPGRHIVSLSGGKDSTALAIFLKGKVPNLEYIFCDTDKELPETYEYLDRLEAFLQQPIMHPRQIGTNAPLICQGACAKYIRTDAVIISSTIFVVVGDVVLRWRAYR